MNEPQEQKQALTEHQERMLKEAGELVMQLGKLFPPGSSCRHFVTSAELLSNELERLYGGVAEPQGNPQSRCPVSEIVEIYRVKCPSLVQPRIVPDAVKQQIAARWRQDVRHQTRKFWEWFFGLVEATDFLAGRSNPRPGAKPFRASLEWIVNPTNFAKIINGNYAEGRQA